MLGLQTVGLALHELISLLMVKAVMISFIYSPLQASGAALGLQQAADALHNSTTNCHAARHAGTERPPNPSGEPDFHFCAQHWHQTSSQALVSCQHFTQRITRIPVKATGCVISLLT